MVNRVKARDRRSYRLGCSMTQTKQISETALRTCSIPVDTTVVERRMLVDIIHSYKDAICSQSEGKVDFNRLCAGTTEKALRGILGEIAANTFIRSLEKYASFKIQDVGKKPEVLVKLLREIYGPSSKIIENRIVKEILEGIKENSPVRIE